MRRPLVVTFLLLLCLVGLVVAPRLYAEVRGRPHLPTHGAMLHPFGVPVAYQSCGFHTGQDWFAAEGTPIFAVEAGDVVYVGPLWLDASDAGRGPHAIVLWHPEGSYYTTYSHNRAALVAPGQSVVRGQQIAEMGNEGYSGNPHLHLEKVVKPFTGNWMQPFEGCDGYVEPGMLWSPW